LVYVEVDVLESQRIVVLGNDVFAWSEEEKEGDAGHVCCAFEGFGCLAWCVCMGDGMFDELDGDGFHS
jgi:hypothetical protein